MNLSQKIDNYPATLFQKKVWHEMRKIPTGSVMSYEELAQKIDKPKAYRAVANACGKNPFPIDVPCHRVIASNNKIGGFSMRGGVSKKKQLLSAEGINL